MLGLCGIARFLVFPIIRKVKDARFWIEICLALFDCYSGMRKAQQQLAVISHEKYILRKQGAEFCQILLFVSFSSPRHLEQKKNSSSYTLRPRQRC